MTTTSITLEEYKTYLEEIKVKYPYFIIEEGEKLWLRKEDRYIVFEFTSLDDNMVHIKYQLEKETSPVSWYIRYADDAKKMMNHLCTIVMD